MAWMFRLARLAPLVAAAIACSAESGTGSQQRALATCGNGILEQGEQCDSMIVPTCAQLTQNPTAVGVAQCSPFCMIYTASCQPNGNPGVGGTNGSSGNPGNGGYPGNGGV